MDEQCADILFALYMNGGGGTVTWLEGLLASGSVKEFRKNLCLLASAGFLRAYIEKDEAYASLTDQGTLVALGAAEVMATRVLAQWPQAA